MEKVERISGYVRGSLLTGLDGLKCVLIAKFPTMSGPESTQWTGLSLVVAI